MAECAQIRPLLYQYLEREAEPAEAMDVANHVSDCTACKILLARKRRLSRMLEEGLEDSIPVGDDFARSVMATLPDGPPPRTPSPERNRGLKLAALLGVLFTLGQTVAGRWPALGPARPTLALPSLDLPAGQGPFQGILELVRWAVMTAETLIGGALFDLPSVSIGLAVSVAAALTMLIGVGSASALLAAVAGSYLRSRT